VDSETKIANMRVLGNSVFPDTTKVRFTGEDATLKELLDQRVPFDVDQKVAIEHIPDVLLYDRGFSGAKIAALSNTVIARRNEEQYIPFEEKIYDYNGFYLHDQSYPPGGYKFCVGADGLYGLGLELKFTNSPETHNESPSNNLKVSAKVQRVDGDVYNLRLIDRTDIVPGSTELYFTGVVEASLEEGDCVFFVLEQNGIGGLIHGAFSTQATIHRIVRVPDKNDPINFYQNYGGNCPSNVVNDITVAAPVGYKNDPIYDVALAFDHGNCSATLTGYIELPEPITQECDPNVLVTCLADANASPEDLGIVFSQEQIMAIVGGFTTLTKFNELKNTVEQLDSSLKQIFGDKPNYDTICNIVGNC
jgi:hypothetical protein